MNVNAPDHLAAYAAKHDIDLTEYRAVLDELKHDGRFINIEAPFADEVRRRLLAGGDIAEAVAEARQVAIDALPQS